MIRKTFTDSSPASYRGVPGSKGTQAQFKRGQVSDTKNANNPCFSFSSHTRLMGLNCCAKGGEERRCQNQLLLRTACTAALLLHAPDTQKQHIKKVQQKAKRTGPICPSSGFEQVRDLSKNIPEPRARLHFVLPFYLFRC